jgi:U3 small nucleolar ribonucleoprotein component
MLSVNLDNGVVLKAIDLGREFQLRTVRPVKNKTSRETWKMIEKSSAQQSFVDAANKQFALIALAEEAHIKPLSKTL